MKGFNDAQHFMYCYIIFQNAAIHETFKVSSAFITRHSFYCIKIFGPSGCPYLIQFVDNSTRNTEFWYHKQFDVAQFIKDIFKTTRNSSDHILMNESLCNLTDLYFEEEDEDDVDMNDEYKMEYKKSDGIQCILSLSRLRKPRAEWLCETLKYFEERHKFDLLKDSYIENHDILTTFNLHMTRMKSKDKSRDIKVAIKCRGNWTFESKNKYIRAPLYVWINRNDTWNIW